MDSTGVEGVLSDDHLLKTPLSYKILISRLHSFRIVNFIKSRI
jgi:hypothetical protein